MSHWSLDLVVDPITCKGRGVCTERLPARMELHRWGYPVDGVEIPPAAMEHALHLVEQTC